jgi:hypothetical protein
MITNSNRVYFDKMLGCGVQEELNIPLEFHTARTGSVYPF